MTDAAAFWRAGAGAVTVAVKVHPRARRTGLLGCIAATDGTRVLRVGVSEPADGGRATAATCAAIADALALPGGAVSVVRGATRRDKVLRLAGDPADLAARLRALAARLA